MVLRVEQCLLFLHLILPGRNVGPELVDSTKTPLNTFPFPFLSSKPNESDWGKARVPHSVKRTGGPEGILAFAAALVFDFDFLAAFT